MVMFFIIMMEILGQISVREIQDHFMGSGATLLMDFLPLEKVPQFFINLPAT